MQQNQPLKGASPSAADGFSQANSVPSDEYTIGSSDTRGWGSYIATDVERDATNNVVACEKRITVNAVSADPAKVGLLSLQSHDERDELWRVESGELTVILDDQKYTLSAGEEIVIPVKALHAMANLGNVPAVVFERQTGATLDNGRTGVCRESDIHRYCDALGRATEPVTGAAGEASLAVYRRVMADLQMIQQAMAGPAHKNS